MSRARYLLAALGSVLLIYVVRETHRQSSPSSTDSNSNLSVTDQSTPRIAPAAPSDGQLDSVKSQDTALDAVPIKLQPNDIQNKSSAQERPNSIESTLHAAKSNAFPTSEEAQVLVKHTWSGGGFMPPSTPGFDELFRNQRKRTGFTYSGLSIQDGVYLVYFSENEKAKPLIFQALLKQTIHNNRSGFLADWIQEQGSPKVSLMDFSSAYVEREIYYGFLNLPVRIFTDLGYALQDCPEVLVIRHFDYDFESSHPSFVTFFNARAYCRTDVDQLRFIGRMGLQYLRP